jgi:hypothetical protein
MPVAYSSDALSLCRNSATLTSTESTGRLFDEPNPAPFDREARKLTFAHGE